nr:hypothetical protein [Tanacetum cinerariifolium]
MSNASFFEYMHVCNKRVYRELLQVTKGRKLCAIVDILTQWEPQSMLAATFIGRYTVCNTLYRYRYEVPEETFLELFKHSSQVAFSIAVDKPNVASV